MTPLEWFAGISVALAAFFTAIFRRYYNPPEQEPIDLPANPLPMPTPAPVVPPVAPVSPPETIEDAYEPPRAENYGDNLDTFCSAIRDYEGGPPNDRNYRNNNPGNARYSQVGYLAKYGHVGKDKDGFAIFATWAIGWEYLRNLILTKATNHPDQAFIDFFSVYAPRSDGNNPTAYAAFVAKRCGVDIRAVVKHYLLNS